MAKKKVKIKNPWNTVEETVERAVRRAWERRLYKHVECPINSESEIQRIVETVSDEVVMQLMDVIKFDGDLS